MKYVTNKHIKIFGQATVLPSKHYGTIFVTFYPYLEKL